MLITVEPAGRFVRIPVELRNKPKNMPWYEYCSRLRSVCVMSPDVELTLHLNIGQFEMLSQEFASSILCQTPRPGLAVKTRAQTALVCGIHILCDVPTYN